MDTTGAFGEVLRRYRQAAGHTQEALAERAHVDLTALRDPAQVTTTIAQSLGVREAGAQHLRDALLAHLRD